MFLVAGRKLGRGLRAGGAAGGARACCRPSPRPRPSARARRTAKAQQPAPQGAGLSLLCSAGLGLACGGAAQGAARGEREGRVAGARGCEGVGARGGRGGCSGRYGAARAAPKTHRQQQARLGAGRAGPAAWRSSRPAWGRVVPSSGQVGYTDSRAASPLAPARSSSGQWEARGRREGACAIAGLAAAERRLGRVNEQTTVFRIV